MTLDRTKVWTGTINEQALEPQPRATVGLYDTTLRDGEQTVGVVLTPEEKLEIARALDAAGIDRIEAGFPRVSDDDCEQCELIAAAGLRAEVWGFSRAVQADVEALVELGVRASVIESPISDGKLDALGVSRETMLERIRSAVAFASEHGIRVAFFGVDSSRADLDFFDRAYEAAVEAGAAEVAVVDTLGIATPEAAAFLVSRARERLDVPVHWHGHDDFGLATAAAVAAVQAGATWVQGTVNGMGERAGNADLIEVALALEALYGIPTRLDLAQARALSRLVAEKAGTPLPPWKAVTGDTLFTRESGARRGPVPRPARDRALLVGARGRPARDRARQEERDRLDPDQARAARARRAAADRQAELLAAVKRLGSGGAAPRDRRRDSPPWPAGCAVRTGDDRAAGVLRGDGVVPLGRRDRHDGLDEGGLPRGLDHDRGLQRLGRTRRRSSSASTSARGRSPRSVPERRFVVNFMGEGRSELCLLFASKAEDKFANISWRPTASGLPLLHEDVARLGGVRDGPRARGRRPRAARRARSRTGVSQPELGRAAHVLPPLVGRVVSGARVGGARPGGDPGDRGERSGPALAGCRDA